MDFLKSAVVSAISGGPPFPYTFGEQVSIDASIWKLYDGIKREDASSCSIFAFDVSSNKFWLPLARNTVKKLKTLRHPGVVKVLDTVETESYIYIATERLVPLRWHVKTKSLSLETLKWGLYCVAKTIKFINDEAKSVHGSLRMGSLYTSESGEWRVGGFEVLSSMGDDEAIIYTCGSRVPDSGRYTAPELAKSGWHTIKHNPIPAVDAYNYGILVFEVFNGDFLSTDQAGQTKNIPPKMHSGYRRLVNNNPKARLSTGHFLEQGRQNNGFFDTPLIKLAEGVNNLGMKNEEEREAFLSDLDQLADDFPEDYFKVKILPELLKSVEYGGGGARVFAVVMKIAMKLTDDDFESKITPVIIRLFGSSDRAIRVCLLDNLPLMIDRLTPKMVNDKIFPQMTTGFTDVTPIVREQTVKAVLTIIAKLSDRTVNGELLKYLAKTSNDEQPGIRTNTTICLGKISRNLGVNTRSKVLIAAFTRSLRDPFVHARNAALLALAVTSDCFSEDDCANRILPALCPCLIDKEKLIRDQVAKTMDTYMQRIKKYASTLPDTVLPPLGAEAAAGATPRMGTIQSTQSASWTGWAISSFTNKVSAAAGDMQSITHGNGTIHTEPRPSSVPLSRQTKNSITPSSGTVCHVKPQVVTSPQLPATSSLASDYFQDSNKTEEDGLDAWGDMDQDHFFDARSNTIPNKAATKLSVSAIPFNDDENPDFAGWLVAQAQKKHGSKPLPKGLAKPSPSTLVRPGSGGRVATTGSVGNGAGTKKLAITKTAPKTVAAKKVDTLPKVADDEHGWSDGW